MFRFTSSPLTSVQKAAQGVAVLLATATLGFGQYAPAQSYNNNQAMQQPQGSSANGPSNRQQAQRALPGTVNFTEGAVAVDQQAVGGSDLPTLQGGQSLSTGSNGFAELLLTPGAFLRLGNNAEVKLVNAGLASTRVQLMQGSAMVEVDQLVPGTDLEVELPNGSARVEKNGLYDFDTASQAVRVLDGKLNVKTDSGSKSIGKDDQLLLASAKPLKSSGFDSKAIKAQPLFVWSEARSRDESQANQEVAQDVSAYGGWGGAGWYWNPYWASYAFLPGDAFLYSPFGWGFYSPVYFGYYGGFYRGGYYHPGYYGGRGYVTGYRGRPTALRSVGGMSASVHSFGGGGFHGGGGGGRR